VSKHKFEKCVSCQKPFSKENVFTDAGQRETQISGMCEVCFDAITSEDDETLSDEEYNELMDKIIQDTAFFEEP
jgi:hypothetical protein